MFFHLPSEVIALCLNYLGYVDRVLHIRPLCRLTRDLTYLFAHVDLHPRSCPNRQLRRLSTDMLLFEHLCRGDWRYTTHLAGLHRLNFTDENVHFITQYLTRLQVIDLSYVSAVSGTGWTYFASHPLTRLQSLSLRHASISREAWAALAINLPCLTHLDVAETALDDASLTAAAAHHSLTGLAVSLAPTLVPMCY
jgi:hypothetical protein